MPLKKHYFINPERNKLVRKSSLENIAKLREALIETDWSQVLTDENVESAFDNFWDKFLLLYNKCIPLCQSTGKNRKKIPKMPWITNSLLRSINKRSINKKKIIL